MRRTQDNKSMMFALTFCGKDDFNFQKKEGHHFQLEGVAQVCSATLHHVCGESTPRSDFQLDIVDDSQLQNRPSSFLQ